MLGGQVGLDGAVLEDHHGLADLRQAREGLLDLGEVDLEAADGDLGVAPAEYGDPPGRRVDPGGVPGVQSAVRPAGGVGEAGVGGVGHGDVQFAAVLVQVHAVDRFGLGVQGAVEVGGDDPEFGHSVHGAQGHAVPGGEGGGQPWADQLAGDDHPAKLRQRQGSGRTGQQFGVERDADHGGRPVVLGDRGQDARRRHPLGDGQWYPGVQAVEQPADQAEDVDDRGEQDDPLPGLGEQLQPPVAVQLAQQVGGRAGDHLGRTGRTRTQLHQGVAGRSRAAARQRHRHGVGLAEAAQRRRRAVRRLHQDLGCQPFDGERDLVRGEAVVQ